MDRTYVSFTLRQHDKYRIYKRSGAKLFNLLGDIGGILEIVTAIGFLVTSPFVVRSMNAAMINSVYHVQKLSKDSSELPKVKVFQEDENFKKSQ